MRALLYTTLLTTVLGASSCNRASQRGDIVDETYVHCYGVEVPPSRWTSSGQNGKVISTLKDGVVVSKTYENGILEGETTCSFPHSDIIEKRAEYVNGVMAKESVYDNTGTPLRETVYEPDQTIVTSWYESGTPHSKEILQGNNIIYGEYYTPAHEIESRIENGHGERVNRDAYGQLLHIDNVADGKLIQRNVYHITGSPHAIIPYQNDLIHGQRKTYHPGGEPHTIEEYANNVQHGITIVYKNGEKYAEVPYEQGHKNGVEKRYRDGKDLIQEIHWVNDTRQGPTFNFVGNTVQVDWYYKDKKVDKSQYDLYMNPITR